MLLAGRSNLRDTIAFPKTASASCLLTNAPGAVSEAQLDELQLKLKAKNEIETRKRGGIKFFQPLREETRPLPLSRKNGKNADRLRAFFV